MSTLQTASAELAFKQHAESVRTSLQTFNALRSIPSKGSVSSPLRLALNELVNAAVREFVSTFDTGY
jgi:hypothetical protein